MNLDRYHNKREFNKTPEPKGEIRLGKNQWRFVIQKHQASRLHYDLRLELDGVLKSWAIPKGPSLDPGEKRLAIRTEDHPLEYASFEGVIPQSEYGGGTVLLWDQGTWSPVNENGFESGDFKFQLNGEKLGGGWMLVHTGRRSKEDKQWLLFKERDEYADPQPTECVLQRFPLSIATGRSLEEISRNPHSVWKEGRLEEVGPTIILKANPVDLSQIDNASSKPARSKTVKPALPTATRTPPSGEEWVHEIKYDGYRMVCHVDEGTISFVSRNGKDWTDKLPSLSSQVASLEVNNAVFDGEVAYVDDQGVTNFQSLQNMIGRGFDHDLRYFIFDILLLNGFDISHLPFETRKKILSQLLPAEHPSLILSEHLSGDAQAIFESAVRLGAEGIVSKRLNRPYPSGRTDEWLKTKSLLEAEFVVGGYTTSTAGREFASLVLGRFDAKGRLLYEGRVGTGFTVHTIRELSSTLAQLETQNSPFANLPNSTAGSEFRWVDPQLVVGVEYGGWTNQHHLRFPSYRGVRSEIAANAVITDRPHQIAEPDERFEVPGLQIPVESLNALVNVRFTNSERLMYPNDGVSKLDVAKYMAQVADRMLPYIVDRPLAMVRCPKGCNEKCFFQKTPPAGMPDCVASVNVANALGKSQTAAVIRDIEGLLTLTQFSALELHNWGCRVDRPDRPDMIVLDIDPDESLPFEKIRQAALQLRSELQEVAFESFVKTTGGKGLHVVVPIRRRSTWDEVTEFCDRLVGSVVSRWPGSYTNRHSKAARKNKIYIDVLRNRFGATAIAPYSTRARNGATVAMPIEWDNLGRVESSAVFTATNAVSLSPAQDPWDGYFECSQTLTRKIIRHWG